MSRSRDQLFETLTTEGALLPSDFLQRLAQRDREVPGLTPDTYHLGSGERLNEAISRSWNRLVAVWTNFTVTVARLPESDAGTTLTREKWLLPFFQELGYGRLSTAKPFEFEGRRYSISHTWQNTPIHLVSFRADLDTRSENIVGARITTPHSMIQEFLNRSEGHLWGIVSNGYRLRLLRDNASLTRQAYVEFDLQSMMQGEVYADFALLWLLLHQSRVEGERPELCWLEKWTQEARQRGARVMDQLRDGVEEAITALGGGFLAHRANAALRDKLNTGTLTKQDYFRQLLRVVYRFLFLFVAEDRELLFTDHVPGEARERYLRHYSLTRLRRMALRLGGTQHADLWHVVRLVFKSLGSETGCAALGLPALGSFLWSEKATPDLNDCHLANRELLQAIRALAFAEHNKVRRPIDYKNIGTEELGSVYESLLEQHPDVHVPTAKFTLGTHAGHERKTSGSYYTPPSLVQCLLDSALEPVLAEACKKPNPEQAILNLKVCDKACGSGHFLIAAAHRIARRLAAVRTGEEEPAPAALRHALRDVIGRCIYGVDINPMAVELCKFALWLEAVEPGKPLSFLDHHIQCGNSLIGATPALMQQGIPDKAFEPIEGDDKKYCAQFKKANKDEATQMQLFAHDDRPWEHLGNLAINVAQLASLPDDTVADIQAKERRYAELVLSGTYESGRQIADAWCAAFVWKKRRQSSTEARDGFDYPITNDIYRRLERNPRDCPPWMREEIRRLADQYQFFHWHLAFPDVFQVPTTGKPENPLCGWSGGFSLVLGNPPWDRVRMEETQFFAAESKEIAEASSATRSKLISRLHSDNPSLAAAWQEYCRETEGFSSLVRNSGLFPLTGRGKFNLAGLFVEGARAVGAPKGMVGILVPTAVATDEAAKLIFNQLVDHRMLVRLLDFENREGLFPAVDSRYRFSLFTFSCSPTNLAGFSAAFCLAAPEETGEPMRLFSISADDIKAINPNSGTCPIVKNQREFQLLRVCHQTQPVLVRHQPSHNPWSAIPTFMFQMSDTRGTFREIDQVDIDSANLTAHAIQDDGTSLELVRLYEAKLIHQFDHRFATFAGQTKADCDAGNARELVSREKVPGVSSITRFWVPQNDFLEKMASRPAQGTWLLSYREITNATNARTIIAAIIPFVAAGRKIPQLYLKADARDTACVLAALNAFVLDWNVRCKLSGTSIGNFFLEQLPIPPPAAFQRSLAGSVLKDWVSARVLELTYTAWDLEPFARDCGYDGPPFRWDEARRFLLRCELDAAFFHLYGIDRDDAAYILDTFPIVKRKDEAKWGTYRTKDVILEIYAALAESQRTGQPYATRLNPAPASVQAAHAPRFDRERVGLEVGDFLLGFVFSMLRYSGGMCDLMRLVRAYALLQQPKVLAALVEPPFEAAGRKWVEASSQPHDGRWFLPILRRMETHDMVSFEVRGDDVIVHQKDPQGPRIDAAVTTDAFLVMRVLDLVPDQAVAESVRRIVPKAPRMALQEAAIPA